MARIKVATMEQKASAARLTFLQHALKDLTGKFHTALKRANRAVSTATYNQANTLRVMRALDKAHEDLGDCLCEIITPHYDRPNKIAQAESELKEHCQNFMDIQLRILKADAIAMNNMNLDKRSMDNIGESSDDCSTIHLGLPKTETELENLTELNTAYNQHTTMLDISDNSAGMAKKQPRQIRVTFKEDKEVTWQHGVTAADRDSAEEFYDASEDPEGVDAADITVTSDKLTNATTKEL